MRPRRTTRRREPGDLPGRRRRSDVAKRKPTAMRHRRRGRRRRGGELDADGPLGQGEDADGEGGRCKRRDAATRLDTDDADGVATRARARAPLEQWRDVTNGADLRVDEEGDGDGESTRPAWSSSGSSGEATRQRGTGRRRGAKQMRRRS